MKEYTYRVESCDPTGVWIWIYDSSNLGYPVQRINAKRQTDPIYNQPEQVVDMVRRCEIEARIGIKEQLEASLIAKEINSRQKEVIITNTSWNDFPV